MKRSLFAIVNEEIRDELPFSETKPSGVNFSRADLSGADLRSANLARADLRDANLSGANLSESDINNAKFGGSNLNDADLRRTKLMGTDFNGANLSGAKLSTSYHGRGGINAVVIGDDGFNGANGEDLNVGAQPENRKAASGATLADDWYVNKAGQLSVRHVGIAKVDDEFRQRLEEVEVELRTLREQLRGQNNPEFIDPAAHQRLQDELGDANEEIDKLKEQLAEKPDGPNIIQMPHTRTAGMSLNRIAELATGTAIGIAGGAALIALIAKVAGGLQWLVEQIQPLLPL